MKYLQIAFVRIILSFIAAGMVIELLLIWTSLESVPVVLKIILIGLMYYGLTLYVNNRR